MSEDLLEMSPSSPGLRVLAPSAPVSVLTRMLQSPTQPDVVISAADGVTVATHAAVLAAASHKLRPLFAGAERGVFSLTVPRIPSSIWHHILSLLHTGAASVPDEATLISLIETAALLRMDELSDALKLTHARCQQDTQGEGGLLDTKGQCSPSKTQHTSTCEAKVTEETSQANSDATARNTGKDSSGGIGGSSWNMPMPYAYSHKQEVVQKHQDETRENQVSLGNENYNRMTQEHTDSIARDMGPVASNVGGHNLWNAQMPCADQYKQAMGNKMSPGFYNSNSIDIGTIARDLDRASSNLDSIMAEVSTYSNVSKRQLWHLPPGATSDPLQHHQDMVQGSQQLATSEYANRMEPMSFRQVLNQTEQAEDIKAETDEIGGGKDGQSVDIDGGRGNGNITDVRSVERSLWDGEKEEVTGYHGYIKQEKDAFKHKVAKNLVKKGIAVLHKQKQDMKSKIAAGKAKDTALTSDGLTSPEGAGDKSRRWIMDITDTVCHLCGHQSVDQREAALHLLVDHGHKRCHRCKSCGSGYVSRRGLREHVNRSAVCGRHVTYVGSAVVISNPDKNPSTINENVAQSSSIGPNVKKPTVQKQPRKITKKRRRSGIRRSLENIINQQAKPARVHRKPLARTKKNFHCMDTMCIKCGNKSSSVKEAADHLRTKHGVQFPFVCRVCAKCYSTQPALTVHFKRVCWSQTDTNTHQGESVKNATECVDGNIYNTSVSSGDINTTAANNCRDGNKAEFNGTGVSGGFRSVNNRVFQGESVKTMTKCSNNNTTVSSEDRNNLLHDFLQGENDKNQTARNINNDKSVSLEYGMYLLQMSAANNEHRPHQSQSNKNTKEYNNNNSINTVSPRNRRQRIQKSTQAIIQERMIPSKCHICSYTNDNLTEVLSHYAVVHSRDNCFNCKTCGKIFRRSQDLYAHYSSKHRAVEKLTARNRVQHSTPNKVHQNGTAGIVNRVDQDSTHDTANKVQHQYSTESTATKEHKDSTQYTANTVHQNNSQGTANEGRTRFSMKDMIDGVIDYSMVQAATNKTCPNNKVHTNTNEEYQENAKSTLDKESPDPLQFSSPTYEGTEESMDYSLLSYEDHDNHFEADFPQDEDPADGQSDLHIVSISRVSSSPKKAAPITHLGSDVQ